MAVSVARSVAALGAEVHAVGDSADPVQKSRACASFTAINRAPGVGDRYLEFLQRDGPRGAIVLPCDDESLEVVARNRAQLVDWGYQPIEANDEIILAM